MIMKEAAVPMGSRFVCRRYNIFLLILSVLLVILIMIRFFSTTFVT